MLVTWREFVREIGATWRHRAPSLPLLGGIFLQLVLLSVVLVRVDLLTFGFRRAFYLAVLGFIPYSLVPPRYRPTMFLLFCIGTIAVVLAGTPDAWLAPRLGLERALLIVIGVSVVAAVCTAKLGFWYKAAILAGVGAFGSLFRIGVLGWESTALVWPILASLTMFRAILLLYDFGTLKQRPTTPTVLSYFLLFPNICTTLFPVVDFRAFSRPVAEEAWATVVSRGRSWIVKGVFHLVGYRLVDQLVMTSPDNVRNGSDLGLFILGSALSYLQVSGLFHLAIGLLLLFGFDLPATNNRYFLASSFTDYWRRVNIYWKDFILKVFYYPTYFKLKTHGPTVALVGATLWSFFVTWALHLYQTWWLKGTVSLTVTDALFWSILGCLVLINSYAEMRRGRVRKQLTGTYRAGDALGVLLRTGGTFLAISLLWSMWSTPSLRTWLALFRHADVATILWLSFAVSVVIVSALVLEVRPGAGMTRPARPETSMWRLIPSTAALLALLAAASPSAQRLVDNVPLQLVYDGLTTGNSVTDLDDLSATPGGYYERLMVADRADLQLWETLRAVRPDEAYAGARPQQPVDDLRKVVALPNASLEAFYTTFETNRYGMRDREYPEQKPPGTLRVAILGSSHVMGWGVRKEEMFETLLEEEFAARPFVGHEDLSVEFLNFSFHGMSPLQQIDEWRLRASRFQSDVALLSVHSLILDVQWVATQIAGLPKTGRPIPFEYLRDVIERNRIVARTPIHSGEARVAAEHEEVLIWCYRTLGDLIRASGALPIAALIPIPQELDEVPASAEGRGGSRSYLEDLQINRRLLEAGGWDVIDLSHVFDRFRPSDVKLPEESQHANPLAHRLIAEALGRELRQNRPLLSLLSATGQIGKQP